VKANRFVLFNQRQRLLEQLVVPLFFLATNGSGGWQGWQGQNEEIIDEIRKKGLAILVVDDEDSFRKSLCFRLRKKYLANVDDVSSGSQAIDRVRQGKTYDLILTDIMMPGMKGTDVFEELRRIDPTLRIIVMSAFSNSEEWTRAELMGATVIDKPIDDETLIRILSGW
jgi:CheY-like chemotaxis protein